MKVFPISEVHIDPGPHPHIPPNGVLFNMSMSLWLQAHLDTVTVGMVNEQVCLWIEDPITEMSFNALGLAAECY
jgi:hypothetical protein